MKTVSVHIMEVDMKVEGTSTYRQLDECHRQCGVSGDVLDVQPPRDDLHTSVSHWQVDRCGHISPENSMKLPTVMKTSSSDQCEQTVCKYAG